MKTLINTKNAPQAVGPYSQAVQVGDLLFCSGQIALDPVTQQIVLGGVQEQTYQVMENMKAVLEAASMTFENVVKATVYVKNMDDFSTVNEVYGSYFTQEPPARECVEVARLPKDVLVEVSVIAHA